MIGYCEWCGAEFIRTTNKVYCGAVCRTLATKHHAQQLQKQARRNKIRNCRRCGRQLSIYNESTECMACQSYGTLKKSDITKRIRDENMWN